MPRSDPEFDDEFDAFDDDEEETTSVQMAYDDALDYAIFCLNTFMHPDASERRDVITLAVRAEQVIATLHDMRTTLRQIPPVPAAKHGVVLDPDVRGCSCGMADYGAPGHEGHDSDDGGER